MATAHALFDNTIDGNIELQAAIARITETARLLNDPQYSKQDKFKMAWKLGFVHLQKLEDHRRP